MIEYGTTGAIRGGKFRPKWLEVLLGRLKVSTSFFVCFNVEVLCP